MLKKINNSKNYFFLIFLFIKMNKKIYHKDIKEENKDFINVIKNK